MIAIIGSTQDLLTTMGGGLDASAVVPTNPINLRVQDGSITQSGFTLLWDDPQTPPPDGYQVQALLDIDPVFDYPFTGNSAAVTGLSADTTYSARVRAFIGSSYSLWILIEGIQTTEVEPASPEGSYTSPDSSVYYVSPDSSEFYQQP